jgi:hypothetical protein
VILALFGREICPLVTLHVPCVCWSERWLLREAVVDNNQFFMQVRECKYLTCQPTARKRDGNQVTAKADSL